MADALWLFAVLRIGLTVFALFLALQTQLPPPCHFEQAQSHWRTFPPFAEGRLEFPFVGVWQRWDACWYTKIATYGYEPGENAVAFFPLFPALIRTVGTDVALAGLVVSAVAYIAAMIGLHRLITMDFDAGVARRTAFYLSIFPSAFFLLAPFTESLFLALSVWTLYAARRRVWLAAAAFGALAALTRVQGIVLCLPLAWEAYLGWRAGRGAVGTPALVGRAVAPAVAVVAPVVALAAFYVLAQRATGQDPIAAQQLWGGGSPFNGPWTLIQASTRWAVEHADPLQALNLTALLGFIALFLAGLDRLPVSYSLFVAPQLAVVATRILPIPLTSTTRLLIVLFPVFVIVALLGQDERFDRAWTVLSLLLLGLLTAAFLRGDFVA